MVAWLTRKPLILEVNSPFFLEQKADEEIRAGWLAAWAERVVCRAATRVIVVTHPLKRIMMNLGVPAERLVVMSNGVNQKHMSPSDDSQETRHELGLSGRVVIGFVGWFKKWHGLELLLEAFHQSGLHESKAALLLIGDGPAMPDLRAYVNTNGLESSVVFTGALAHADVPRYLSAIDVAVQPAANEYCCPMKILEYMSLGKPLVALRQENIEELVCDGVNAELFRPNDRADLVRALNRLVDDPAMRQSMGRNAQESIVSRGLLWSNNAQRIIDLVDGSKIAYC
jgi:glycosyltransferase involved in cell wall biosynthesis